MELAMMSPEAPVLLIKLESLGAGGQMRERGWEAMLAKSLLAQLAPEAKDVLRGPAGIELQVSSRLAYCNGVELSLTTTEFSLLQELLSRDGAVVSADDLSSAIWGHETLGAPNYVEAHVSRLRRKLRDAGAPRVIETVRGAGYRIRRTHAQMPSMMATRTDADATMPTATAYETRSAA